MWKRVIWTADRIPQTMRDVETRYCVVSAPKFADAPIMMGGVITIAYVKILFKTMRKYLLTTCQHSQSMLKSKQKSKNNRHPILKAKERRSLS